MHWNAASNVEQGQPIGNFVQGIAELNLLPKEQACHTRIEHGYRKYSVIEWGEYMFENQIVSKKCPRDM